MHNRLNKALHFRTIEGVILDFTCDGCGETGLVNNTATPEEVAAIMLDHFTCAGEDVG